MCSKATKIDIHKYDDINCSNYDMAACRLTHHKVVGAFRRMQPSKAQSQETPAAAAYAAVFSMTCLIFAFIRCSIPDQTVLLAAVVPGMSAASEDQDTRGGGCLQGSVQTAQRSRSLVQGSRHRCILYICICQATRDISSMCQTAPHKFASPTPFISNITTTSGKSTGQVA